MKFKLFTLALIVSLLLISSVDGRIWTDPSGKFRIDAEFVSLNGPNVTLRKPDGTDVVVPLERLSRDDVEFARQKAWLPAGAEITEEPKVLPNGVVTAAALKKITQKKTEAKDIYRLNLDFLAAADVSENEKTQIREENDTWRERAEGDRVRLGLRWVAREEREAAERNTEELMNQATRLVELRSSASVKEKLTAASRANPEDFRADFVHGIYNALIMLDCADAEKNFEESAKRLAPATHELTTLDKGNYGAVLNNLALAEMRGKRFGEAVRHFEESSEYIPNSPELVQNLGRFIFLMERHDAKNLVPYRSRVADAYSKIVSITGSRNFTENAGWLYAFYITPQSSATTTKSISASERPTTPPPKSGVDWKNMRLVWTGSGFVVAEDHIVTNRHVAEDLDAVAIYMGKSAAKPAIVKSIQRPPKEDLALLYCAGLGLPAVSISDDPVKRGTEVMVLGFPQPELLGYEIKATRGIVTSLTQPERLMFAMDATVNGGNSGGPVFDRSGNVYGVATAIIKKENVSGNTYSWAVPAAAVRTFLSKHIPKLPAPRPNSTMDWTALDELGSKSTVLILGYKSASKIGLETSPEESPGPPSSPKDRKRKRHPFEDVYCVQCYGKVDLKCPGSCARGTKTVQTRQQTGVHPTLGTPIFGLVPQKITCDVCNGSGILRCTNCVAGIDRFLLGDKSPASTPETTQPRVIIVPNYVPSTGYWLTTKTGVRHNITCHYYGSTDSGRPCSSYEGRACTKCGG